MDDTRNAPGTRDLQGWKEIAAYLGKSVRAAQRWEAEMALPVHRLRTPAGQIVFAKSDEIDAWRARQEIPPDADEITTLERKGQTQPVSPAKSRFTRHIGAAAVAAALLLAAIVGIALRQASASVPTQFALEDQRLVARDAAGHEIWSYTFPHEVQPFNPDTFRHLSTSIHRADLDGDGRPEILAITSYKYDAGLRNDALWCFTEDGRPLWTYEPRVPLTFDGRTFSGIWEITDVLIGPGPGPQRLWISAAVSPWWPSAVFEIDKGGHARTIFVQSGVVYSLALSTRGNQPRIWAGGVNNEYAKASIALLDPDAYAVSPQTAGSPYQCGNCGAGRPLKYILFPQSELNAATRQPYNRVAAIDEKVSGGMQVITREGDRSGAEVVYELDNDRGFRATPADTFWLLHEELTRNGALTHAVPNCPERMAERTLTVWTPAEGWTELREQPHAIAAPGLPK